MMQSAATARLCVWIVGAITFWCLIAPTTAEAAPFCMSVLGMQPQCIYQDADNCRRDSLRQGGTCVPNPDETRLGYGSGQYCMMTAQGASVCAYLEFASCDLDARRQHGTCYFDAQRATGAPNPYAVSNGR
jgi:hypothetical protein